MKMVDMALSDEDILDSPMPIPMAKKARYPYGLRISLCAEQIKALGLDIGKVTIGDTIDLRAFAEVTSVSSDDCGDRIELQIQKLAAENEATEYDDVEASEPAGRRSPLYTRRRRA
jgi:hypothetical protein